MVADLRSAYRELEVDTNQEGHQNQWDSAAIIENQRKSAVGAGPCLKDAPLSPLMF